MVVRFELDGVIESAKYNGSSKKAANKGSVTSADDLADLLGGAKLKPKYLPLPIPKVHASGLKVISTNYDSPPQSSYLEIKTKSYKMEIDYPNIYGQLFFSQTPNLYIARHDKGDFSARNVEKLSLDGQGIMKRMEKQCEVAVGKTGTMVKRMVEVVKQHNKVAFVWRGAEVQVWKADDGAVPSLSDEALEILNAAQDNDSDTQEDNSD